MGDLSNLEELTLRGNRLTGPIHPELGNLVNLERIEIAGNRLTGCIPAGLRRVADKDFHSLGLSLCSGP